MSPFDIGIIDIVIVAVLVLSMLIGRSSGFVQSLIFVFSWIFAIVLGLMFYKSIGQTIFPADFSLEWLPDVTGFAIVLVLVLLGGALLQTYLKKFIEDIGLGSLDRFLGMLLGFIAGAFMVIAVGIILDLTTIPDEIWKNSILLEFLMKFEVFIQDILDSVFGSIELPETGSVLLQNF